jgi:hypothetical protein
MSGYLELARQELERLNEEIEPFQEALNRLIETRDAWATIIRNATPDAGRTAHPPSHDAAPRNSSNPYPQEYSARPSTPPYPEDRPEPLGSQAQNETGEDYGWKINAVREMFRSTYPRP